MHSWALWRVQAGEKHLAYSNNLASNHKKWQPKKKLKQEAGALTRLEYTLWSTSK